MPLPEVNRSAVFLRELSPGALPSIAKFKSHLIRTKEKPRSPEEETD